MRPDTLRTLSRAIARRALHAVLIAAASGPLLCPPAQAQTVRKCQIDGRVVFQSAPCPIEARGGGAAPAAPAEVAVAPGGVPKKKTLAEVLRERDGAERPRPLARDAQGDGANVLRSRMGAV
jgi:hypothetical protein